MDLRTGYPPLEAWRGPAVEHALVATDGSWGLLGTEDLDAVLGGRRTIVDVALPHLGETGAAAAPAFLELYAEWAADVLVHLYGTDWRATLGL